MFHLAAYQKLMPNLKPKEKNFEQECIPVGCVPSAAVVVSGGGVSAKGGYLPGGVSLGGCLPRGVSAGGVCPDTPL